MNLVLRHFDPLSPPQDITLVLYINDITLRETSSQEVQQTSLAILIRYDMSVIWEILIRY